MLSKILGVLWITLGIIWSIRPESLRDRLQKKMNRRIRRTILGFVVIFSFLLIGSVLKAHGLLPKIIGIIGMVMAIKAIMMITSHTSEKVFQWWGTTPIVFFRVWAACFIALGIMLMFVK